MQGHIGFSLLYTDSRVILYTYQSDKISVRSIVDAFQSQDISLNKKNQVITAILEIIMTNSSRVSQI